MPIDLSNPQYTFTGPELNDAMNRLHELAIPNDSDLGKFLATHPNAIIYPDGDLGYALSYYLTSPHDPQQKIQSWKFFNKQGKATAHGKSIQRQPIERMEMPNMSDKLKDTLRQHVSRLGRYQIPKDSDLAKLLAEHPTAHVQSTQHGYSLTWYDASERSHGFVGSRIARFDKNGRQVDLIATKSAAFRYGQNKIKLKPVLPPNKDRE